MTGKVGEGVDLPGRVVVLDAKIWQKVEQEEEQLEGEPTQGEHYDYGDQHLDNLRTKEHKNYHDKFNQFFLDINIFFRKT